MSLVTPWEEPERILVFGGEGVGKTKGAIDILNATEAKGWWIDTERAFGRVKDSGRIQGEVEAYDIRKLARASGRTDWEETIDAVREVSMKMGPDDWMIVDIAGKTWPWAQTFFSQGVYGKSSEAYLMAARAAAASAGKKSGNFDGLHDWPTITRIHEEFYDEVLLAQGHVYLTASAKKIRDDLPNSEEVETIYGPVGFQPVGQGQLGHNCHTIAFMGRNMAGEWIFTTVKDREPRVGVSRVKWGSSAEPGDFAREYLKKHGGWDRASVLAARAKAEG